MLEYKGFIAETTFDIDAKFFHGEVKNIVDVVTFQSESAEELEQAFIDSVEDYLEFCKSAELK